MGKYKFDKLQKKILERIDIDSNRSSFNIVIDNGNISFYPLTKNKKLVFSGLIWIMDYRGIKT